jgi:hypothetical protein
MDPTRRTEAVIGRLDFNDDETRAAFEEGMRMVSEGLRHLRDVLGADSPADNFFIREAAICHFLRLVQVGDRWSTDARSSQGEDIEIKSTRLARPDQPIQFPTSRNVSDTVIRRFRDADWWAFGVFNAYERPIAIFKVTAEDMRPLIDEIDAKRLAAEADPRKKELNNPKLAYSKIRRIAEPIFFDDENYEDYLTKGGAWKILPKPSAPPIPPTEVAAAEDAPVTTQPMLFGGGESA